MILPGKLLCELTVVRMCAYNYFLTAYTTVIYASDELYNNSKLFTNRITVPIYLQCGFIRKQTLRDKITRLLLMTYLPR